MKNLCVILSIILTFIWCITCLILNNIDMLKEGAGVGFIITIILIYTTD